MVESRRRNTADQVGTGSVAGAPCEAAAKSFKKGHTCRVRRESPLKEEFSYSMGPLIRRSRSSQLVSSEGLKGYSRGGAGEEICREHLPGHRAPPVATACSPARLGLQGQSWSSHKWIIRKVRSLVPEALT